ncbi:MAG: RICIN domain-containing protein, partial [Micromonosporaceae bacterium]|nr:RICIN domain-containing protein [Micromonosporaceae bacterium]
WGSIHVPFTCGPDATPETCPIQLNTKFDTIRNFTHYIRPGDRLVAVNDPSSVAAIRPASDAATVVSVNAGLSPRAVTLDLSGFGTIAQRSTVTPVVSSAAGGLVRGDAVAVSGTSVALTVPAQSVTTFLIDGVSGVGTGLVQPNHVYRLSGVQSGRCLVPASSSDPAGAPTGIVIATTDESRVDQLWSLRPMTAEAGNRTRYTIVNVGTGQRLAARDGVAVLEDPPATGTTGNTRSTGDSSAQWIMSTTGDGTWTFVNAGTGRLLDVSGQATADGSPVSTWTPTSGPNQRWTVIDETVLATSQVTTYTLPGLAPVLPGTVGAVYRDGCRGTLPVTWSRVPDHRWRTPGTVRVRGTATDPLGRTIPAEAIVTVDTFSSSRPARAKAYLGGQPDLPATVTGIGDHGGTAELPVTWDPIAGQSPGSAGVTSLPGLARLVDGTTVDATVRIQTTEPVRVNAALDPGVVASATFTESGYSAEALRNGETTDKGWLYDATATAIAIEGTPVPDFRSETTSYELAACFSGRRPDVAVTPSDPYAEVAVTVDRRRRDLIAIDVTITSEDGSRTETYRITVARC